MPVPHLNIRIVQRSKGSSAVAGAAYQAGEKLFSEYDQKSKDHRRKQPEVVYTEILLPANAPPEYADRATLWNAAEEVEKQWNAQLARRFVLALPREVPLGKCPQMLKEYCEEHFVSKGMCCDFAIHDPDPPGHNPHCHFMLTMRAIDENGKWMLETLKKEGVDISHLKIGDGATAVTYMDMDGKDRVHGDYVEGVLENIVFDEEDIEFAAEHDLVHTALWGKAENTLPKIAAKGIPIAFDYADRLDHPLVEETLPYVTYGFYSYHEGRDAKIEEFLKDKVSRGMKIAVVTFGEDGSLAWDGERFYVGGIEKAEVVNTVGAGDSFIAGFLYGILNGKSIDECLKKGAEVAASVVQVFEPWVE